MLSTFFLCTCHTTHLLLGLANALWLHLGIGVVLGARLWRHRHQGLTDGALPALALFQPDPALCQKPQHCCVQQTCVYYVLCAATFSPVLLFARFLHKRNCHSQRGRSLLSRRTVFHAFQVLIGVSARKQNSYFPAHSSKISLWPLPNERRKIASFRIHPNSVHIVLFLSVHRCGTLQVVLCFFQTCVPVKDRHDSEMHCELTLTPCLVWAGQERHLPAELTTGASVGSTLPRVGSSPT